MKNNEIIIRKKDRDLSKKSTIDIRGGCAFSPDVIDLDMVSLRDKKHETRFALGTGALELDIDSENENLREVSGKKDFSPEELREIFRSIEFKEHTTASEAKLVLLEIGPYLVHAYWEIPSVKLEELKDIHGSNMDNHKLVLRFYEIAYFGSNEVVNQFDIDVKGLKNNWYNNLWESGKKYIADIGFVLKDGSFKRMARSNPVELPTDKKPSEATDKTAKVSEKIQPQRPIVPQIFVLSDTNLKAEIKHAANPFTDTHAANRIKDVYKRLRYEGPRVLKGREPFQPTPRSVLLEEYRLKMLEKRKKENISSQPFIVKPAKRRTADISRISIEKSSAEKNVTSDLSQNSKRDRVSDNMLAVKVNNRINTKVLTPVNTREEIPNESDSFLTGINIMPKPEPKRYWAERSVQGNSVTKNAVKSKYNNDAQDSDFLEGIDLSTHDNPQNSCNNTISAENINIPQDNKNSFEISANLDIKGFVPAGMSIEVDGKEISTNNKGDFSLECAIDNGLVKIPYSLFDKEGNVKSCGEIKLSMSEQECFSTWDKLKIMH